MKLPTRPTPKLAVTKTIRLKLMLSSQNPVAISQAFMSIPELRNCVIDLLADNLGEVPNEMRNKIHGDVSILMKKNFDHLRYFDLNAVTEEMLEKFPELVKIILSIMLPKAKRTSPEKYTEIIPRLAFIYGCILQHRNPECSMVQRLVSACLTSNICNQKVRNIPARYLLMIIQIMILSNIMLMIFIDYSV